MKQQSRQVRRMDERKRKKMLDAIATKPENRLIVGMIGELGQAINALLHRVYALEEAVHKSGDMLEKSQLADAPYSPGDQKNLLTDINGSLHAEGCNASDRSCPTMSSKR